MVLSQGHSKMSGYVSEFTKRNIPVHVSGESNFALEYSLRLFVNLFEALYNTIGF